MGELHLIVLWHNARYKEKEIISDIKENLDIVDTYAITWSKNKIANNFTRFYGVYLPNASHKEKECGVGEFLCLVVRDNNPKYEYIETSRGIEKVNINIFGLKQKYRSWTRGGHKIHTTNTVKETNHDASLMLGLNYEDLQKSLPQNYNGEVKIIKRDITGANGWNNLNELFYTLNATVDYVVLRNAEILPDSFRSNLHGDIDILTNNKQSIIYIANAIPVFDETWRVHYYSIISNQKVFFDFRYVGDDYYCRKFEIDLLKNKELNEHKIYVVSKYYLFFSLIYHALIHKRIIAIDYYDKIYNLFVELGFDKKYDITKYASSFDLYFVLLRNFIKNNGYTYTKPYDKSVFFADKYTKIEELIDYFESNFNYKNIYPINTDKVSACDNIFLSAIDENDVNIFIKVNKSSTLSRNEYHKSKELYNIDSKHFIKPLYYKDNRDNKDISFFANELITDKSLERIIENNELSVKDKSALIDDLYDIFVALCKSDVVHRDIRPSNLLYHNEHLVLIDFQLAVSKYRYKEFKFLRKNIKLLKGLGTDDFRLKQYYWDDAYSLLKVLEFIGKDKENEDKYNFVYEKIKNEIGRNFVQFRVNSILRKEKFSNGRRNIYLFGIKIFSYKKNVKL